MGRALYKLRSGAGRKRGPTKKKNGSDFGTERARTTVPILLPDALPTAGPEPKLYVTAAGSRNAWSFELDGAPNCFGANA